MPGPSGCIIQLVGFDTQPYGVIEYSNSPAHTLYAVIVPFYSLGLRCHAFFPTSSPAFHAFFSNAISSSASCSHMHNQSQLMFSGIQFAWHSLSSQLILYYSDFSRTLMVSSSHINCHDSGIGQFESHRSNQRPTSFFTPEEHERVLLGHASTNPVGDRFKA